jgi:hypothetical protein
MIDPFSNKIRSFHNLNINKNDMCYIGTNDYGLFRIEKILREYNNRETTETCHIGVSGYYNFDIAVFRKSNRIIIFDNNEQQVKFMKQTLKSINISKNREQFINNMMLYLNIKYKEYSILLNEKALDFHKYKTEGMNFMINISEDDSYKNLKLPDDVGTEAISEIIYELERKGSWLSNDDSYNYIRKLVIKDHIAIFCEDIKSVDIFKRISNILNNNNIFIDTLYLTNVKCYMENNEKLLYNQSLKYLSNNKTLIIETKKILNIRINDIEL